MQPGQNQPTERALDFHGAALIDEQGREVPITEDMIRQACEKLERRWHYPVNRTRQAG